MLPSNNDFININLLLKRINCTSMEALVGKQFRNVDEVLCTMT